MWDPLRILLRILHMTKGQICNGCRMVKARVTPFCVGTPWHVGCGRGGVMVSCDDDLSRFIMSGAYLSTPYLPPTSSVFAVSQAS